MPRTKEMAYWNDGSYDDVDDWADFKSLIWARLGRLHRTADKPALISVEKDGGRIVEAIFYRAGIEARSNGPSTYRFELTGELYEVSFNQGEGLHRLDGPAKITLEKDDGSLDGYRDTITLYFCLNGEGVDKIEVISSFPGESVLLQEKHTKSSKGGTHG